MEKEIRFNKDFIKEIEKELSEKQELITGTGLKSPEGILSTASKEETEALQLALGILTENGLIGKFIKAWRASK